MNENLIQEKVGIEILKTYRTRIEMKIEWDWQVVTNILPKSIYIGGMQS